MRQSMLGFIGVAVMAGFAAAVPNPNPFPAPAEKDFTPATQTYKNGPDKGRINYDVTVAQTSHEFRPNYINATIGDTITFKFYPQEHSAVLADFESPCVPWSLQHPGQQDVWSGMIKETEHRENPQTWVYRVTTSDPTFFYCSGPSSCKGWGMVFAINQNEEQSFLDFQSRAKLANYQISPGETPPKEGGEYADEGGDNGKDGLSTGALAGIVVGAIAGLALIGLLFFFVGKSRRKSAAEKAPAVAAPTPVVPQQVQFDHPPPGYDARYSAQPAGWDTVKPPVSPGLSVPHGSTYNSPNPGHTSWAPSELGGETSARPVVEIYTPGVDELIPLNSTPRN